MRTNKSVLLSFILGLLICHPAFGQFSGEQKLIVEVDEAMLEAANQRDVESWLSHWSEDGAMWPHCEPRVVGKEALREYISGFFSIPTFTVSHDIESVVVADSGDLGYITYSYRIGDPLIEAGKDLSIFRKDSEGNWKIHIDMWSTNEPPCQ